MNAEILPLLNLALHGILLGALSWTLVRFFVRDARHRSIAASGAILVTVLGPLGITLLPSWPETTEIPVLTAIHQTLEADWKVAVQASPELLPESESATPAALQTWSPGLAANALGWVWAAGTLGWFFLHLLQTIRVWGWSAGLRRASASELETLPDSLRKQELRVFDHAGSPCVVGWLRPVIAVPASAFGRLSPRQWHWAIRHEKEHLRGADTRVLWLHECARAVVWWNPFVHGLAEIHSLAREEVCDAEALAGDDETKGYSEFLLDWASRPEPFGGAASSGVMAMARSRPVRRLKARLLALAEGRQVGRRVQGWFVAFLVMLALLITGVVSLVGVSAAAAQPPASVTEKEAAGDAELLTRSYQVSPDFLPGLASGVEAKGALEKKGIEFPAGASAILIESSSKLIARNTRTAHARIESLVAASQRQFPQVHFQGRYIQTDHFLGKHGEVITSQAAEQMIREMSQKKGVDLLSAPSVTSRQGQQAVVEICRANPANEQQKVGLRQELNAVAARKGKVELQTKTEFFKVPGIPMLPPRDLASVNWDRVKTYEVAGKAPLASGETLVLHLPMDSQSVTVLISVKAVRPDGQDAASFNESFDTAPARQTGDGVMLPADAFIREVEQNRNAEKRASTPRITLKMVTASFSDGRQMERALMPDAAEDTPRDTPPVSSNTGWILRAVFVEEQLQKMLGHLEKDSKTTLTPAIQKTAAGGAETVFTPADGNRLGAFKVTPVIGADEHTVDLRVELQGDGTVAPKFPPSSVTVWNGQTVMFCSSPSGPGRDGTAIFLTVGWPEK